MQQWNREIEAQRAIWAESAKQRKASGTSETQFTSMRGLHIENPHQENEEDDDHFNHGVHAAYPGPEQGQHAGFALSRNASGVNLASSSTGTTTANPSSGHPVISSGLPGKPPPRFPMPDPSSLPPLNTSFGSTPGDRAGHSYFSPIERETSTPGTASARSSSQSVFSSYGRRGTPSNGWGNGEEYTNRNTAPAMSRAQAGGSSGGNPYMVNNRDARTRPSLPPVSTAPPTQQQPANGTNRMRSASSPDFNNPQKRGHSGQNASNGRDVPNVPAIPPHVAGRVVPVNRSNNNSPTGHAGRAQTPSGHGSHLDSSHGTRPVVPSHYTYDPSFVSKHDPRQVSSTLTPGSSVSTIDRDRNMSTPVSTPSSDGDLMPSQLKAKVWYENNYVTLVIASNIQFQSLVDRIDAKISRFTKGSLWDGEIRLHYRDEDGDYILLDSDEAVYDAFVDWRETQTDKTGNGLSGEIVLFCSIIPNDSLNGG